MQHDIVPDIIKRLLNDYEFQQKDNWLQKGICPSCGKKELYTNAEKPFYIRCGRENKCGYNDNIKDIYPDLFKQFNQRYQATEANPNATADAYMQLARGLDLKKIKGQYKQGMFYHPRAVNNTSTVRFMIDEKNDVYMERFIEDVIIIDEHDEKNTRRANFKGSHKGLWWQPKGMEIKSFEQVFMVEGIIDALSLWSVGIKAVALLSCHNYPEQSIKKYLNQLVHWVVALDNDIAGLKWTKKHAQRLQKEGENVQAALIPDKKKVDWNDAFKQDKLKKDDIKNYLYHGSLHIATTALDKALIIWREKNRNGFSLDFNNKLYWFSLDLDKFTKAAEDLRSNENQNNKNIDEAAIQMKAAESSGALAVIANCRPQFLYFQENKTTDESWYYVQVTLPSHKVVKNTFTGSHATSSSEFTKRLFSIAGGAIWKGNQNQLIEFVEKQTTNIKTVETIDYLGYSKEYKSYIFNNLAVSKGAVYEINSEDYFQIGKHAIKSLNKSIDLHIGNAAKYQPEFINWLYNGFGAKGLVALTFWFGSLFAEQLRATQKSFPFLEVIGEPGAGKTTLIEFLWKLFGRPDEEGFDPCKSTAAAMSRKFSQLSNLPNVLIEADREDNNGQTRQFDWDELKPLYNGRSTRSRGVKNSGNETQDPPFRASIVITQNNPVQASRAILERIVHVSFDKSGHTDETKTITDHMNLVDVETLSYFLIAATIKEQQILKVVRERTPMFEQRLMQHESITIVRLAKNHAQILALLDALTLVLKIDEKMLADTRACIHQLCIQRHEAVTSDHPIVDQFWELYDYLNESDEKPKLNHSRSDEFIAISLPHFIKRANEYKQQVPLLSDLKKYLKSSRRHKFVDQKTVASKIVTVQDINGADKGKSIKCWVFIKTKTKKQTAENRRQAV